MFGSTKTNWILNYLFFTQNSLQQCPYTCFQHIHTNSNIRAFHSCIRTWYQVRIRTCSRVRMIVIMYVYEQFFARIRTWKMSVYELHDSPYMWILHMHTSSIICNSERNVRIRTLQSSYTCIWYNNTNFRPTNLDPSESPFRWSSLLYFFVFLQATPGATSSIYEDFWRFCSCFFCVGFVGPLHCGNLSFALVVCKIFMVYCTHFVRWFCVVIL